MLRKDPFVTGEYYHIYNRGVDKRVIFKSDSDYKRFVMLLYVANSNGESFRLDNLINQQRKTFYEILNLERDEPFVSIGSWCLMPNHFHILVRQEMDGGISKFMKKLGTAYSMYFNIKYERQGALFGGLFKSKLIDKKDIYLKHLFAYINLNPLDIEFSGWDKDFKNSKTSKLEQFLKNYKYSSYLDLIGNSRIEGRLMKLENFPNYFEEGQSFKDFIKNYFVQDKV